MQEASSAVTPSTQTNYPQFNDTLHVESVIITDAESSLVSNHLDLNEFERSSIWAKKFISDIVPRQSLHTRFTPTERNLMFSPLTLNTISQQVQFLSENLSKNLQVSPSIEPELESQSTSTLYKSGYPICLESKSVYHLTNLSVNLKKTYENSPRFGSLERAHMEWMATNEITPNRLAYLRSRKMETYRNFIFKGATPELRYVMLNEFLVRKDMYPKKETTFIPPYLNKALQGAADTCESWYKQGQNFALSILNRNKEAGNGEEGRTHSLFSDLEGKTITIDWDKAFQHALRSHSIAQMLGIPPQVLFLTGFAAIDIKQIILSDDLQNVEKMIFVAQIVLKTIIKIMVVMGTQLFTSGLWGLGGIDVISVPFGVHGTRYLEGQITERVFKVIDTHFDSSVKRTIPEKIIDC